MLRPCLSGEINDAALSRGEQVMAHAMAAGRGAPRQSSPAAAPPSCGGYLAQGAVLRTGSATLLSERGWFYAATLPTLPKRVL